MKIRAGDSVVIITGKDKGKTGKVLRVLAGGKRVIVADCNMRTKHIRRTPTTAGQRVKYEASMDRSNVMLLDAKTKKRTRVGYLIDEKGKKARIAKRSGEFVKDHKLVSSKSSNKKDAQKSEDKETLSKEENKKIEKLKDKEVKTEIKKIKEVKIPGENKPFWKKMGFGESAVHDAVGSSDKVISEKDHSVPDQGQKSDSFSHQRGK